MKTIHAFVDGGYLLKAGTTLGVKWPCPTSLARRIVRRSQIEHWFGQPPPVLMRCTYYDGCPDQGQLNPERELYWSLIREVDKTHLGFGYMKPGEGTRARPRQKAVDTLIAVDMLTGAFDRIFDMAILVSGDADFVPVVEETRRRGVSVVVAACKPDASVSSDLVSASDCFIDIEPRNPTADSIYDRTVWLEDIAGI